jgi:ribokinase
MSICVLGSINMDVVTCVDHLPRPGETIVSAQLDYLPGGKGANQAIAAARLGGNSALVGAVGRDRHGTTLVDYLARNGVDVRQVQQKPDVATGQAFICVAQSGENTIVVAPGANYALTVGELQVDDWQEHEVFLVQLEVPPNVVEAFLGCAAARSKLKIINAAPALPAHRRLFRLADVVVVNETELAAYAGAVSAASETGEISAQASSLLCRKAQTIVVTLGAHGALAVSAERSVKIGGHQVQIVRDTTGAGDSFCGALAVQMSRDMTDIESALRFANLAAAISVTRLGATSAMPTGEEVIEFAERLSSLR